jgi:two-component system chemotaxis sensor kinase CheA
MGDALLVSDLSGQLTGEKSRIATEWFGPISAGVPIWEYLAGDDRNFQENFLLGFDGIVDGYLPFEITSAQAPRTLVRGGRTYRLSYRQVEENGTFVRLVVILSDITEELIRQQAEQASRELPQIVNSLLWNTDGFRAFIEETETLLSELARGHLSLEVAKRHLHTLKGTTAVQGFLSYSQRVHALENDVAELGMSALSLAATSELTDAFRRALAPINALLEQQGHDMLSVLPNEHQDLLSSIKREASYGELLQIAASWHLPRTDSLLAPLAGQGKRIAERLDKQVEIDIKPGETRIPSAEFRPFFSTLVHVFRNALDHGIETPEERRARGKSEVGRVALSAYRSASRFVVEVRDDGRGIDWERIREKAESQGLPASSQSDLERALFTDGLSTRDEVTALSGRGVGLSATLEACHKVGGQCLIETARGHGTTFRFVFPIPERVADAAE